MQPRGPVKFQSLDTRNIHLTLTHRLLAHVFVLLQALWTCPWTMGHMQSVSSMQIEAHGLRISLICGHSMAERCRELHVESAAEL